MWNSLSDRWSRAEEEAKLELPSRSDRLILYKRVALAVEKQCEEYASLTDPRALNPLASIFTSSKRIDVTRTGIRKRQIGFLRLEFLPTVSAALLLELSDLEEEEQSNEEEGIQQPVACIALLVSNMVLVSQGNYDARVRSILKSVCVQVLLENPNACRTVSSGKRRTLYLLTPKKSKEVDGKKKKTKETELEVSHETLELSPRQQATIQLEAIEKAVATDILQVMVERDNKTKANQESPNMKKGFRYHAVRGLQITTVGVLVGSLFAVTGGLAAPGLVAAITAFGVHGSVMFATLTTTTALASMFGVVGGGLGAYKMSKRSKGLTEWKIRKEGTAPVKRGRFGRQQEEDKVTLTGLHATVCVSGWLASESDFQTPFGIRPNAPVLADKEIALRRFFAVHDPTKIQQVKLMLKEVSSNSRQRKKDLAAFWKKLKEIYGQNPDELLPLGGGGATAASLDVDLQGCIYNLLVQHCLTEKAAEKLKELWETSTMLVQMVAKNQEMTEASTASFLDPSESENADMIVTALGNGDDTELRDEDITACCVGDPESLIETTTQTRRLDSNVSELSRQNSADASGELVHSEEQDDDNRSSSEQQENKEEEETGQEEQDRPKDASVTDATSGESEEGDEESSAKEDHSQIIWDWQATYSGEMYTITWETTFLLKLCQVATTLFLELSDQIGKQILTQSLVGATLALPSALLTSCGVIDDPYQIIALRSKMAGEELAHCLLTSSDEHRPISLVGFSFGARVIFDCLLELAKHQEIWQEQQESIDEASERSGRISRRKSTMYNIDYVREPASIVEDVVLIGMPRTITAEEWIRCREIVAGRVVNCFNRKDWMISYMINIRCAGGIRKTSGTHPVQNIEGVENYEVSDLVSTHGRYLVTVPQILHKVGYSQPRTFA